MSDLQEWEESFMSDTVKDVMTKDVVWVSPATNIPEIARILQSHGISACPVIDGNGHLVGMVSEGDLLKPFVAEKHVRRDWWLDLVAEGQPLAADFLAYIQNDHRTAADVMSKELVVASPATTLSEVAGLLTRRHLKRLPIVDDEKVIGIVSRADLVERIAKKGSI